MSVESHLCKAHHSFGVPVQVFKQAVVVPGGHTPERGVLVQQDGCCCKEVQVVWAELHVILAYDGMAVSPLGIEQAIQAPLVVLCQPCMPWLARPTLIKLATATAVPDAHIILCCCLSHACPGWPHPYCWTQLRWTQPRWTQP